MSKLQGALAGIRVIEFGRFIAAPYCCQLLADAGADVIKVEPLDGDDARRNGERYSATEARQFLNKNRNKRSLACDLSDPDVINALQTLVTDADIVVANFRPGQAAKYGLDYDSVAKRNPGIIYAENSGFGPAGPLANVAGMDMALQGYSGLAPLTIEGPLPLPDPVIDYAAAMLMAWGVSVALFHRERTGEGQKLDVSLLQASLVLQNNNINETRRFAESEHRFAEYLKQAFANGNSWEEILQKRQEGATLGATVAYYGFFRTADQIICLGAGGTVVQKRLLELLGLQDPLIEDPDFEFADVAAHVQRQREQVEQKLRERELSHWLTAMADAQIPASRVNLKVQMLDDEQVQANGYVSEFEHETLGAVKVVSPPVQFSATPLTVRSPSPTLGSHSREILAEAGLSDEDIDRMLETGVIAGTQGQPDPE